MNTAFANRVNGLKGALASTHSIAEAQLHSLAEAFPQAAIDKLTELDIHRLYIPIQEGGELRSLTQLVELWRALAYVDLTLAIAHGKTFLGCVCTWIAGTSEQKALVGTWVNDHQSLSWGLTERDHGADLMATQTRADITPSGWCLNGEKWLINNASRSSVITVLARTAEHEGARNQSLFLVNKTNLGARQFTHLDKIHTHGIRGADISGITLTQAELPANALIGSMGAGLEITLKALQITRIACCGLSLGALEGAFDTAVRFAQGHRLYGRALIELDTVQDLLVETLTTLWFSEITAWMAARVADYMPGELAVTSALAKAAIPSRIATQLAQLEEQMGARGFVTDLPGAEHFEKRIRDHQIIPIFDGSTLVCRASLVPHLPGLVRHYRNGTTNQAGMNHINDHHSVNLGVAFNNLTLLSRTGCSLVQTIPALVNALLSCSPAEAHQYELNTFLNEANKVIDRLGSASIQHPDVPVKTLFGIEAYEWLFIGACCLNFWLGKAKTQASMGHFPDWLVLTLNRINRELLRESGRAHTQCAEKDILKNQLGSNFELISVSLFEQEKDSQIHG